ncbi:hypothetical protein WN55_00561 [Dufourea novaeangliae]|uniref:Uncharacterized protein n=1 Tax=Dufourea novaeangliae TaxID=178035 RepID=A0A154PDD3_DUFNO|nr:hypothetical protein WN55_00561 [Dufourea novaeangliae]
MNTIYQDSCVYSPEEPSVCWNRVPTPTRFPISNSLEEHPREYSMSDRNAIHQASLSTDWCCS